MSVLPADRRNVLRSRRGPPPCLTRECHARARFFTGVLRRRSHRADGDRSAASVGRRGAVGCFVRASASVELARIPTAAEGAVEHHQGGGGLTACGGDLDLLGEEAALDVEQLLVVDEALLVESGGEAAPLATRGRALERAGRCSWVKVVIAVSTS